MLFNQTRLQRQQLERNLIFWCSTGNAKSFDTRSGHTFTVEPVVLSANGWDKSFIFVTTGVKRAGQLLLVNKLFKKRLHLVLAA